MARGPAQLPLTLTHPPQYGRDSFLAGPSNAAALSLIERWPDWPSPVLVLSGPAGSGKTHLTHIWAERSGASIVAADDLDPQPRAALAEGGTLAVEDVPPDAAPEAALFHLINSVGEASGGLLLTARAPAAEWRVGLPDLASRLRMASPVALLPPDDDLLRQVLVKLFADRQMMVDKAVLDYLLPRMERSLGAARLLVEALDREALADARRITRPLAARVLARASDMPAEFTEPE